MRLPGLFLAASWPLLRGAAAKVHSWDADDDVPWYEAVSSEHFPELYAKDLGPDTIKQTLEDSSAEHVLVDFYLPWCPHCQHFAPEFQRLALKLQEEASPSILTGVLDCVAYESYCRQYKLKGFPALLWGTRDDWLRGDIKKLKLVKLEEEAHTAEGVADWIKENTSVGVHIDVSSIPLDQITKSMGFLVRAEAESQGAPSAGVDQWDMQVAVALFLRNAMKATGSDSAEELADLTALTQLLAARLPEAGGASKCSNSLSKLEGLLVSPVYTDDRIDVDKIEENWQLCGTPWSEYKKGWRSCKGTIPDKRGFTCGLWSTLHTLAARTTDEAAGRDTKVMRAALKHFFECEECRDHFFTIPFDESDIRTRRDAQLWWWTAHNAVNQRVKENEETMNDGDPSFPKIQWPSSDLCPSCRKKASSFLLRASSGGGFPALVQSAAQDGWVLDRVAECLDVFYKVA